MTRASVGLSFQNLTVAYGAHTVLNGISSSIEPGKFVALIGPNGSGKSTLIRALCGLVAYRGSILLEGVEVRVATRRALGRAVGLLPQGAAPDSDLTVYDLISLGHLPHEGLLTARRADERERDVLDAANRMQLDDLLFKNVSRISGGEAQRSMIAMLLVQNPAVYLLDEPSSATDVKHSVAIFSLFRRMAAEQGCVVVAAVHDVNLALRFAGEVVALKGGDIRMAGPAALVDGDLLESLYDIRFEKFASPDGTFAWHATEASR